MVKRTLAAVLWFFVVAYAWDYVAAILGVSELPGLLLGAAAAVLIAGDPLGRIWTQGDATSAAEAPAIAEPA